MVKSHAATLKSSCDYHRTRDQVSDQRYGQILILIAAHAIWNSKLGHTGEVSYSNILHFELEEGVYINVPGLVLIP